MLQLNGTRNCDLIFRKPACNSLRATEITLVSLDSADNTAGEMKIHIVNIKRPIKSREQNILPTWSTNGELFFKTTNIGINSTN
jgi:hypothetical protein